MIADRLLSRRNFLAGAGLCLASACSTVRTPIGDTAASRIAELESNLGGRVGVAAIDTTNSARISYRADERFAICSTFKLLLAAAVLARVDRGEITLAQPIPYGSQDLLNYSPVTKAHLSEGALPLNTLLQAALETSDNTAANLLLPLTGDPPGLTRFLRENGDNVTRLDRNEPTLNNNVPGDARDTTTPNAMVASMNTILLGPLLSRDSREKLIGWMKNCRTGSSRLRAGLPKDWTAGDKTGTGDNGAANDVAILWPPNRAPILIAAYLSASKATPRALEETHAKIAKIVSTELE